MYAVLEEYVEESGRDVSPVGKELHVEPLCLDCPYLRIPVIHVCASETERYNLSSVVADEVQLEAVTPSHRPLAVPVQPIITKLSDTYIRLTHVNIENQI